MNRITFSIAKQFTRKPGLRYRQQSDYSGEEFREKFLLSEYDKAVLDKYILVVNLDNTFGYGPSFLEEAFGGLARIRDKGTICRHLEFVSEEEPQLIGEIKEYINDAIKI